MPSSAFVSCRSSSSAFNRTQTPLLKCCDSLVNSAQPEVRVCFRNRIEIALAPCVVAFHRRPPTKPTTLLLCGKVYVVNNAHLGNPQLRVHQRAFSNLYRREQHSRTANAKLGKGSGSDKSCVRSMNSGRSILNASKRLSWQYAGKNVFCSSPYLSHCPRLR
jgi:hypothetical protein